MVYGGRCSHFDPHREYAVATHSVEGLGIWWESGKLVGFSPLERAGREMTKLSNKCLKIAKIVETTNLWP